MTIIRNPYPMGSEPRGNVYAADVRRPSKWGDRVVARIDVEDANDGWPDYNPNILTNISVGMAPTPAEMREIATILREAADAAERYEAHALRDLAADDLPTDMLMGGRR